MKKLVLFIMALGITCSLYSQESKFYFKAMGGFSFEAAVTEHPGADIQKVLDPSTMQPISFTENGLYGSYGGGGKAGAALGYRINKIVGFEMGLNYFQSGDELRERTNVTVNGVPGAFNFEQTAYARALALIPSLVLTTGKENAPAPYARFSFVVPVWGDLIIDTKIVDPFGMVDPQLAGQRAHYTRQDKIDPVKPQIGFEGAMGMTMPIKNGINFFVEAEFRTLTVDGATRETTKFDVAVGNEQLKSLGDFPRGVTEGVFHQSLNHGMNVAEFSDGTENPNFDPSRPADELTPFANINGFGFNVGFTFDL